MLALAQKEAPVVTDELSDTLALCSVSTKAWCQTLMPEHFYGPFSSLHNEVCAAIDDPNIKKVCIISGRGFGKTSLVTKGFCGRQIAYRLSPYIVYISKSAPNAIEKTENIKRELLQNRHIRKLFGSIKVADHEFDDMDDQFAKTAWVANGSTLVFPRGAGQQVRGLLFDRYRPTVIVMDDLEDDDNIRNENYRREMWHYVRGEVEESISQYDDNHKIIYIDTVKHQDCIPLKLSKLPDWKTFILPMADEEGNSLVPELISNEKMRAKMESHRIAGTLDVFAREFQCKPASSDIAAFTRPFNYYDPFDIALQREMKSLDSVVIIDPAKTANPKADDTAIIGNTIDLFRRRWYTREIISERLHPDETADKAIGLAERIGAKVIAIEVTGLGEYATYPIKTHILSKGKWFHIVELHARKGENERGKMERIKALIPFYRRGQVFHNPHYCAKLEDQLLAFPNCAAWDCADAQAYMVQVLDDGERFFFPDNFDPDDREQSEKELEEFLREDKAQETYAEYGVI